MMKKDIEWLKEEIGDLPITDTVFISDCISYVDTAVSIMSVYDLIDQLDEPEVLSQEWIDKNKTSIDRKLDGTPIYKVREELLQNLLIPKQESLETLTVPTDLGEWLQSRRIGDSGVYFTMLDELCHYWESVAGSKTGVFIAQNRKELIEVILGSRGYRIEEPLYYALIKGHELIDSGKTYWYFDNHNNGVFVSKLHAVYGDFLTEMSKSDWNKLGINDSNADFVCQTE